MTRKRRRKGHEQITMKCPECGREVPEQDLDHCDVCGGNVCKHCEDDHECD
jgi:rRNA maturation endonuclease Nob1